MPHTARVRSGRTWPPAAEAFPRIIDGHQGLAATSGPVPPRPSRRPASATSIDSITLSDRRRSGRTLAEPPICTLGRAARAVRDRRETGLLRGGSLPRPTGGSPPGAALPPGGCPRIRRQPVPSATRRARRTGRAAVVTPGRLTPRKITTRRTGQGAGRPLGRELEAASPPGPTRCAAHGTGPPLRPQDCFAPRIRAAAFGRS